MTILDDKIKNLTADNILLRGIVAVLLSQVFSEKNDRQKAAKRVIALMKPEIEAHIKGYQNMNEQLGRKELERIQQRCGEFFFLADSS